MDDKRDEQERDENRKPSEKTGYWAVPSVRRNFGNRRSAEKSRKRPSVR